MLLLLLGVRARRMLAWFIVLTVLSFFWNTGAKKKRSGCRGRADWFAAYSPDTGKVYMVSVWEAPDASYMTLRLLRSKNNQEQGVKWAKDYEI
jgi:PD-(D/E)XK endonuclease